jgi:hypothetical protein
MAPAVACMSAHVRKPVSLAGAVTWALKSRRTKDQSGQMNAKMEVRISDQRLLSIRAVPGVPHGEP